MIQMGETINSNDLSFSAVFSLGEIDKSTAAKKSKRRRRLGKTKGRLIVTMRRQRGALVSASTQKNCRQFARHLG